MKYTISRKIHTKNERIHKTQRFFWSFLIVAIVAAIGVAVYIWWLAVRPEQVQQSELRQGETVSAKVFTIENEYFTYVSEVNWELNEVESKPPGTYVYVRKSDGLVHGVLTVYLQTVPADTKVTYVLPVEPEGSSLLPGELSPKCSVPKGSRLDPIRQVYQNISFICIPDRQEMIIAAGQPGSSYAIKLDGSTKSVQAIGLVYRDTQFSTTPQVFTAITKSFKLR